MKVVGKVKLEKKKKRSGGRGKGEWSKNRFRMEKEPRRGPPTNLRGAMSAKGETAKPSGGRWLPSFSVWGPLAARSACAGLALCCSHMKPSVHFTVSLFSFGYSDSHLPQVPVPCQRVQVKKTKKKQQTTQQKKR